MAVSVCSSSSSCGLLLLLLSLAAIHGATAREGGHPLGANCGSIDPCRGGVANDLCCKAINVAISQGTLSCACRQLAIYGQAQLVAACSGKSACPKCRGCKCASYTDGPSYISTQ